MKIKNLPTLLVLALLSFYCAKGQAPFFNTNFYVCAGTNSTAPQTATAIVTSTAAGATSYSWAALPSSGCAATFSVLGSSNGSLIAISYPCPTNYTLTCMAYNGTSLVASSSSLISYFAGGGITLTNSSSGGSVCPGGTATLTALTFTPFTASSFTWTGAGSTSSVAIVNPTVTTCYTVGAQFNPSGCISYTTTCVNVSSLGTPTLSIGGSVVNGSICSNATSMQGLGATNYTWYPGNIVSSVLNFTPVQNACYTLTGSNGCSNATASIVQCLTVVPAPTLTISGPSNICGGNSATLLATGASTYQWATYTPSFVSLSGSSIVITPTSSTCYSLFANNGICSSQMQHCFTVTPGSPAITGGGNICIGQSAILNIGVAGNYTWTGGPSPSNNMPYTVTPSVSTCYTLNGTTIGGCPVSTVVCVTVSNTVPITVFGTTATCANNTGTVVASGASSYTWQPGGYTGSIGYVSAGNCYTVTGMSASGCSGTAVHCVSLSPQSPTFTANTNTMLAQCPGTTFTLATSPISYTWNLYSSGSAVLLSTSIGTQISIAMPTTTASYGVFVYSSSSGCGNSFSTTVVPLQAPTLSFGTIGVLCAGSSLNLSASGATSYSWSTGGTGASIVVSPSVNTCYSVAATGSTGCLANSAICVTVVPVPNITVSGSSTLCAGTQKTFTATGATSYTWSNATTGAITSVSPSANTCYSVTGTNIWGCSTTAVKCVTVLTAPLVISPATQTVCKGTSAGFTASGASTYTWSTNANTSTLSVLSASATVISLSGTGSNGCLATTFATLTIDTTCSNVWPGDANSDGVVNSSDVFELGLAANATGSARSSASIAYIAQFANNWSGTVSTGKNKCHADCNGDGVVNAMDTSAINANFSLTHAFRSAAASGSGITLVPQVPEANTGNWNVFDIVLGDAASNVNQLFGLSFEINFDQTLVQTDSVKLIYTTSFFDPNNQNINFAKKYFNNGKVYAASVRTGNGDVDGNGKIGEFWFKLKPGFMNGTSFNFGITNSQKINSQASAETIASGGQMNISMSADPLGLNKTLSAANRMAFYPNPTGGSVTLINGDSDNTVYRIYDLMGRQLQSGEFNSIKTINMSEYNQGVYLLEFESVRGKFLEKLIIEK